MEECRSEVMEELWRIKDEMSSRYATFREFFDALLLRQEELKRQGVKFVSFPPRRPEFATA